MKNYEVCIGEAIRIEVDESTGKLFLIFEITDPKHKQEIMKTWTEDLEFRLINKQLIKEEKL
jgi:hypothetical protein